MSSTASEQIWSRYCAQSDPLRRAEDVAALGAAWETEPGALELLLRALGDGGPCREEPSISDAAPHVVRVGERARVQLLRRPKLSLPAVAMLLEAPEASEAQLPASPHYERVTALKQAIELIDRCRTRAAPFLPSVVATIAAADPELSTAAARCLGRVAGGDPDVRPVIRACFDNPELAAGALRASFELKVEDVADWGGCFAALLSDARNEVREGAARQLKRLGRAARPFVPQIAAALGKEAWLNPLLFEALRATDHCDPACFEAIERILTGGDVISVQSALRYLEQLGSRARPMLPALVAIKNREIPGLPALIAELTAP